MDRKEKRVKRTNEAFIPIFHIISPHRCVRKFPRPVIRRGGISRPDSNRRVRSNVRESQARTLSAGRFCTCYYPFLFHPSGCSVHLPFLQTLICFFSLDRNFSHIESARHQRRKSAHRKRRKEKREKERREYYSSKLSLYISVRLTLNHNERSWLKTQSRVIGAFTRF